MSELHHLVQESCAQPIDVPHVCRAQPIHYLEQFSCIAVAADVVQAATHDVDLRAR
jgi:hypothetical protein